MTAVLRVKLNQNLGLIWLLLYNTFTLIVCHDFIDHKNLYSNISANCLLK